MGGAPIVASCCREGREMGSSQYASVLPSHRTAPVTDATALIRVRELAAEGGERLVGDTIGDEREPWTKRITKGGPAVDTSHVDHSLDRDRPAPASSEKKPRTRGGKGRRKSRGSSSPHLRAHLPRRRPILGVASTPMRALGHLLSALLLLGCAGARGGDGARADAAVSATEASVPQSFVRTEGPLTVQAMPLSMRLTRGATTVLQSPAARPFIEVGVVAGGASPTRFYDPRVDTPSGVTWRAFDRVLPPAGLRDTGLRLGGPGGLRASLTIARDVRRTWVTLAVEGDEVVLLRFNFAADDGPITGSASSSRAPTRGGASWRCSFTQGVRPRAPTSNACPCPSS